MEKEIRSVQRTHLLCFLFLTLICTFLGPIVYVDLAGQSMVVLNTHKVATDLLDKRASIYSDRPRLIVASEIMSRGLILGFMRSNDVYVLYQMFRAPYSRVIFQLAGNASGKVPMSQWFSLSLGFEF
jgi:hypothetical protein